MKIGAAVTILDWPDDIQKKPLKGQKKIVVKEERKDETKGHQSFIEEFYVYIWKGTRAHRDKIHARGLITTSAKIFFSDFDEVYDFISHSTLERSFNVTKANQLTEAAGISKEKKGSLIILTFFNRSEYVILFQQVSIHIDYRIISPMKISLQIILNMIYLMNFD
jgi:hypothetical protein